MSVTHSKITAQGQISVPLEVRRRLAVGPGSILEWEQDGDRMIVRRAGKFSSVDIHTALFSAPPKRRTLDDLKAGIARHLRAKHARD
ncbi:MAG: AbrB/MazE/SpoVT family DNA-binding domain-containing protein [Acidobacteriaceae bacterium]|jgi:AbrB family looped-hinge helix DNA binding protein|nr:AbrB/MazE/SpoVT family DNA-binding domain-containing protein [Acidobacteriaceae bacterium]